VSRVSSKYLAVDFCAMTVPFIKTGGEMPVLREKVVYMDLSAFFTMFHLSNQKGKLFRV